MTKQTIEELIPEIKEKCGWYYYEHDSMSSEVKPGTPELGASLHLQYVKSFHNYPQNGTHTFEDGMEEFNYNLIYNQSFWIKNGRIFVPTNEIVRGKVNIRKEVIVNIPRNDFWGKLGFTKSITENRIVEEDGNVPIYKAMPYFSNPKLGTGYFKFGLWPFTTCNRGLCPVVHLGMLLPTAMAKYDTDIPDIKEDLYSKVVNLIRENPYNASILLKDITEHGTNPIPELHIFVEHYHMQGNQSTAVTGRHDILKPTEEQTKEFQRYVDARAKK